jgi:hypothetical protein
MGGMVASSPYGYSGPAADPTAVVGRRIGAFFIDAAVAFAIGLLLFFILADHTTVGEARLKYGCTVERLDRINGRDSTTLHCPGKLAFDVDNEVWVADPGPFFGLSTLFSFAYFALLPGLTGWTLGKLLVGLRIVDGQGKVAGLGRNIIRWLLFVVDGPLTLFLCGLITMLVSKGHRRLGDMVAGTYVVSVRSVGTPPLQPSVPGYGPGTPPGYGPTPPASYGGPPAASWPTPGQQQPAPVADPFASPPPAAPSPAAPAPAPQPSAPASVAGPVGAPPPVWDQARNTYLQWDPMAGRYLQWDPARQTWKPLDT